MKTKLLLIASAAILSLGMGSANAAPVQLTTAQMDTVSAGAFLYRNIIVAPQTAVNIAVLNYGWTYQSAVNVFKIR